MAAAATMEFEKPIVELEKQIDELKRLAGDRQLSVVEEIAPLERKLGELRAEIYRNLTPLQRVQVARNSRRPFTSDYLQLAFTDFVELHGDRLYREDAAIIAGWARLEGETVMVIGHQRGRDTKESLKRNFGMPHPEGYRKGMRVFELAERFNLPIVTIVDVPGAHPGPESEERGIAEAIARSIGLMSRLRTPIVAIITGEGGSGGALANAVGDTVIALENAVYSVISPEGCAAILWRTAEEAPTAALAMKMSAQDQLELGVIDRVVAEPGEGAHADKRETARRLRSVIIAELDRLSAMTPDELVAARYRRYRALGPYTEVAAAVVAPPPSRGLADRLRDLLDPTRWSMGTPPSGPSRRDEPPASEEV
jgi:acetyl-CoA carboxylase carboxyl transferase subunit alpha